jgi:hypothetical protein
MRRPQIELLVCCMLAAACAQSADKAASDFHGSIPLFQTSDRCLACHNGLTASSGEDVSIGLDWRASIMANSARDPYWQASVRRESIDHARSQSAIEDECASCHMPMARYQAKTQGAKGSVFAHLAAGPAAPGGHAALDGVSCSLCHQISAEKLGQPETFNGQFIIATPPAGQLRVEFGPFDIDAGLQRIMRSSSGGFAPTRADHIRQSELCASCHTLRTNALGPDGRVVGSLPEQMPYQEWLHSSYANERSCQSCHMPVIAEPVAISRVLGEPRSGMARHVFVGGNFFMQRMLGRYREELGVVAQPVELTAAANRTIEHLKSSAAQVTIEHATRHAGKLDMKVQVQNLGGHRLPTAYPSRRVWLHVLVTDAAHRTVFESGALNSDGSIQGNDNDRDATQFEPHYRVIRSADQVQIYESVLSDSEGRVTTGLLNAVGYLKDNRLLPRGFDKTTAAPEIAVLGDAAIDPAFNDAGHAVAYSIDAPSTGTPLQIDVELLYQPIGYRWAHNLAPYDAPEPRRFVSYFDSMKSGSAVPLATAETTVRSD